MKRFNLINLTTKKLKQKDILSICKLKNSYWPWTLSNQVKWFKSNVKKMDINVMLIYEKKLVGYTLLRKRKAYQNNKQFNYLYFDTFLIHKNLRKQGAGEALVLFNNKVIKKLKKTAFLICSKNIVKFYLKYSWKLLPKKSFKIVDHETRWFKKKLNIFGMTYNFDKKFNKKIYFYLNN
tara:strand:- start:18503 stop:19039 length:537 start_codon:yes stop_codon:yes gene_type:complete